MEPNLQLQFITKSSDQNLTTASDEPYHWLGKFGARATLSYDLQVMVCKLGFR